MNDKKIKPVPIPLLRPASSLFDAKSKIKWKKNISTNLDFRDNSISNPDGQNQAV